MKNAILGTENFFMWIAVFIILLFIMPIFLLIGFTIWFVLWIPSIPYLLLTKRNALGDLTNHMSKGE